MKTICLSFITMKNDEVGRFHLPEYQIASAGEYGFTPIRPLLADQMEGLYAQIARCLETEGIIVALDSLELQITVSRALIRPCEGDEVLIELPIREYTEKNSHHQDEKLGMKDGEEPQWDNLFDLGGEEGEL